MRCVQISRRKFVGSVKNPEAVIPCRQPRSGALPLEAEGYVYTVSGRGTFVSEGQEQNRQRRREVTARVLPLMAELRDLGMTREEWTDLWKGGDRDA